MSIKDELLLDLVYGGVTNIVILTQFVRKSIKGDVRDKLLKHLRTSQLQQNTTKSAFELKAVDYFEALLELDYTYFHVYKKQPNWTIVLDSLPKKSGISIISSSHIIS